MIVKSVANEALDDLFTSLKSDKSTFNNQLIRELISFRKDPEKFDVYKVSKIPDGSPIGSAPCFMNWGTADDESRNSCHLIFVKV